jgi:hypothetical protein
MAKSCPDCGAEVDYHARAIEVLEGTCASCGRATVVVAPSSATVGDGERAAVAAAAPAAPCWECGGPLAFTVNSDRSIDAACTACEATTHLTVAGAPGPGGEDDEEDEEEEDRPRPPRRPPSFAGGRSPPGRPGRWDDDRRGPRREFGADSRPPARPCRQCGGALEFTKDDDGTVTGTCRSCGNTFKMRPREDRPSGGFERRSGWGGRPGGSNYSNRSRPPYRRAPRRDDDERPRRRRRED